MIISVASGKGGTGKTTIAVNLALSLKNVQFLDCDVEEPNAHIFLKPQIQEQKKAFIPVPDIDPSKCVYCGRCAEVCVYNALAILPGQNGKKGSSLTFANLCHGCGACSALCPENAIREINREIGVVELGHCAEMEFIHGRLNIGETMSPPLIRQVKKHLNPDKTVIIDAPPGTSCPVVASIKGSDYVLLVTEPTPFGLNDLILALEVLKKMQIPCGVVINRADIGDGKVDDYCQAQNISVLMRLPFAREIAELYSNGIPLVSAKKEFLDQFRNVFDLIKKELTA
ncbi:MAG: ATP-binding protein [Candidatus Omnitrophota bacterium]